MPLFFFILRLTQALLFACPWPRGHPGSGFRQHGTFLLLSINFRPAGRKLINRGYEMRRLRICGAAMYHPTGRALTVLELLQSRPSITGPELAERLEMDVRTVRRYITILQDIGIPIEGTIGRHGGYRLRPGFKLPPLMFTEEEATAIALGLLGTSWLEIGLSSAAIEGALAKVARVLPARGRERLNAVSAHLILSPHTRE